ncbi:MAG TPA: hypothetical protein ENG62_01640, partial [Thermoplasmatales archaeon]|nr:hypothetical protein [Thermoplasmatales archaeon]
NMGEVNRILGICDGIGVSSISDWDYNELKKLAEHTHRMSKIFAIHASEYTRENIDKILLLKPSFLVHMVHATIEDLEKVKKKNIPVVVCPRSNRFFSMEPNLENLYKAKITLMIGTDNGMLHSFNLLEELKIIKDVNLWSIEEILNMVTYTPRKILNLNDNIPGSTLPSTLIVLDKETFEIKEWVGRGMICL